MTTLDRRNLLTGLVGVCGAAAMLGVTASQAVALPRAVPITPDNKGAGVGSDDAHKHAEGGEEGLVHKAQWGDRGRRRRRRRWWRGRWLWY